MDRRKPFLTNIWSAYTLNVPGERTYLSVQKFDTFDDALFQFSRQGIIGSDVAVQTFRVDGAYLLLEEIRADFGSWYRSIYDRYINEEWLANIERLLKSFLRFAWFSFSLLRFKTNFLFGHEFCFISFFVFVGVFSELQWSCTLTISTEIGWMG